ncbi:inner membrane peptidase complex catalytic subunit 2 [Schizosaccharomyces japonicus yFS275]|uniref:Mitochondrial inner membrane protease subunit 2 n=1 Tax=Schizosaccharomyces japonicus (strain yFS275 / FY16936) TaxID=402676 RepID=B6K187_SCHJY|nr:inner membrane peptidase complex catalytic subunit 2 [Schizosaccharomyces japonicus yFS275]EEB07708.1 inner membrane peptidase complex catalytic subunit 2 [Schizosaccharomyces japonicus yFS275]
MAWTFSFSQGFRTWTHRVLRIGLWIPVYFFVDHNLYSVSSVKGRSMKPTLNPETNLLREDVVLLNKWNSNYRRGDIVTVLSPLNPKLTMVKRIVAIENDIVCTRKPHTKKTTTIPKGHVWIEGDEQFHSVDSNSFGPVPTGLITGKVVWILYPFKRFGSTEIHDIKEVSSSRIKTSSHDK